MSNLEYEINRRRTFAIISHPDAGKTTLTEKFLLYGGAINLAGSVKGKATWRLLLDYKNGIQGVIACIDEMQNWFSSNQSKNFPPEMLEVITQNRKNRRVIMGTAQTFNRLSKPIREQATEVRRCTTLFGCLTIVHRVVPELDSEGNVEKWKHRGFYYFVHDEKLRSSYDTWRVIESLSKSGFQPAPVVVQS